MDRATGAILKTSGQIDALQTAKSRNASTAASFSNDAPAAEEGEAQGVEEFAEMIWNFVNSSGQLVQDVDAEVDAAITAITPFSSRLRNTAHAKAN